jgi:hypothetical protein
MYSTQNYWVFGICPYSGILKYRKHNVSETGSVSILRWIERHLLPFYPSSTNMRALSQFILNISLLSPFDIAWSQIFK